MTIRFQLNGEDVSFDGADDLPLLWYLRDEVFLRGTKYGCGIAACGACTVHIDGRATRSCITPVSTLERPRRYDNRRSRRRWHAACCAAGLDRGRRAAVRLLPVRATDGGSRPAGAGCRPRGRRHRINFEYLPLRCLSTDPQGHQKSCRTRQKRVATRQRLLGTVPITAALAEYAAGRVRVPG